MTRARARGVQRDRTALEQEGNPCPEVVRDPATVSAEIAAVQSAIQAAQVEDARSTEEVTEAYRRATKALTKKTEYFDNVRRQRREAHVATERAQLCELTLG